MNVEEKNDERFESTEDNLAAAERWDLLALTFGYNELAKTARTLGEKVWCRMSRDAARDALIDRGGDVKITSEEVICTISEMPKIAFTAKDIELMKAAIAEFERAA